MTPFFRFPDFFRRIEKLSPPETLGKRERIYIAPTRPGMVFVLFLLAMLLGSINYGNNLGFLLTFLLGSMGVVSLFYTHGSLKNIRLESVEIPRVFAGVEAGILLSFSSQKKKHPALQCAFDPTRPIIFDLFPNQSTKVIIPVPTHHRGKQSLWPLRISSEYPLGLFRSWVWIDCAMVLLVYPAPISAEISQIQTDSTGNDSARILTRPGVEDFKGLRGYQRGDSLQRIAWKASFRGQGLMIKEFQGNSKEAFWLDFADIPFADLETKLSILCGMVLKASDFHEIYGLRLPHIQILPSSGEAHKHNCLTALALYNESSKEASRGNE